MKKTLALMALIIMGVSCSTINTTNSGMLFIDAKSTTMVSDGTNATKMGSACTTGVIGIVTGDSSIEAAMKAGNIKKVSFVDHKAKSVLGIYTEYCTIVHGM